MSPLLLSLLGGLLLGIAFPPSPFGVLSFVAFVPLLIAIDAMGESAKRRSIVGALYAAFFVYHGIANWWVLSWQSQTDPYLMASGAALWLGHPFFLSLPFYALASIRRRLGRRIFLWCTPFAIAGFEWLHGQTDASYPWLTVGYDLVHTPFAQIADLVGVYGLSFLIAIVNVVLTYWMMSRSTPKASARPLLIVATIVVLWGGLGLYRGHIFAHDTQVGGSVRVAMVQPNENPWDKWSDPRLQVENHKRYVDQATLGTPKPDVVVWSETAIPYTIRQAPYQQDFRDLSHWVDTSGFTLLTGFADRMIYAPGQAPASARTSTADASVRYDHFNAAMTIQPKQGVTGIHRKSMLTPFAERLPFADQLSFAMSWIEWGVGISAWGKGLTRDPLPVIRGTDTVARVGTIICIESIYPEVARDMVNNGANLLCVITNDAWYNGTWGPEQHYSIARMRAIEMRRDLIRCAMSGETGVIRRDGSSEPTDRIAPMTSGVLQASAQTSEHMSAYAIVGDVVPPAGLFLCLILVIGTRIPYVVRKMRVRTKI